MADVYVWNGGSGTGASWATAYTTLAAACTAKAAGDTFWVAHDHAETQASAMTITSPGTDLLPCRVYCVNRAGSVPPVAADLRTTATVTTTGAFALNVTGGFAECYGIIFNCGNTTGIATLSITFGSARSARFVNCAFRLNGTSASSRINFSSSHANHTILENCTVQFANAGQAISTGATGSFIWRNTASAITGATLPTSLVLFGTGVTGRYLFEGVDFSALGSGKTLFPGVAAGSGQQLVLKDCKLGASVAVATNSSVMGADVILLRCDSGDTNYRTERYNFMGTQTTETTIVRTGGATDGTTPISWKIVTTANSEWEFPFECLPISIWNETVGSAVTVTVQGIWGSGSVPRNDDIWIDVEYLGTSGFPLASPATSNKANGLAADAALAAGTGTWGGSTTKFAMSATFTPQEKGPFTIYVRAALPSTTFYVDPKPVVT